MCLSWGRGTGISAGLRPSLVVLLIVSKGVDYVRCGVTVLTSKMQFLKELEYSSWRGLC